MYMINTYMLMKCSFCKLYVRLCSLENHGTVYDTLNRPIAILELHVTDLLSLRAGQDAGC